MATYRSVAVLVDGRIYTGEWRLEVGMLHVSSLYGAKSEMAGPHPDEQAQRMLAEIVEDQRRGR